MTDHHQRVGFQSDQDLYEDLFGRGPGDGDVYGYPGQEEANELATRNESNAALGEDYV